MMKNVQSDAGAHEGPDPLMIMDESGDCPMGFAVVMEKVVGEVIFGSDSGYVSLHHAALSVIGRSGEEGRFTFPNEYSGRTVVEITFPLREDKS